MGQTVELIIVKERVGPNRATASGRYMVAVTREEDGRIIPDMSMSHKSSREIDKRIAEWQAAARNGRGPEVRIVHDDRDR